MTQTVLFTLGTSPGTWLPLAQDLLRNAPAGLDLMLRGYSDWLQQQSELALAAGTPLAGALDALAEQAPARTALAELASARKASWGGLSVQGHAALPLLCQVFPQACFIILVESPAVSLAAELLSDADCDATEVLDRWTASARRILRHIHAHPGRSVVMAAEEVRQNRTLSAMVLHERTGIAFREPTAATAMLTSSAGDALSLYLAEGPAAQHVASASAYIELQAACLPLLDDTSPARPGRAGVDLRSAMARLRMLELARQGVERLGSERDAAELARETACTERDAALAEAAEVLLRQHTLEQQLAALLLSQETDAQRISVLAAERDDVKAQLGASQGVVQSQRGEIDRLVGEMEIGRRLQDVAAQTEQALRQQLLNTEVGRETAVRHREELQRQIEKVRAAAEEQRQELSRATAANRQQSQQMTELEARSKVADKESASRHERILALTAQRQQQDEALNTLRAQVAATEQESATRHERILALTAQRQQQDEALQSLRSQVAATEQESATRHEHILALTAQREQQDDSLNALRSQIATAEQESANRHQRILALTAQVQQQAQAQAILEDKAARAEREFATYKHKASDQLQLANSKAQELQLLLTNAQTERARQSEAAQTATTQQQLLLQQLHRAHGEVTALKAQMRELDQRLPFVGAALAQGLDVGRATVGELRNKPPHRDLNFEFSELRLPDRVPGPLAVRLVEHLGRPGLVIFADGPPVLRQWKETGREGDRPLALFVPTDSDSQDRLRKLAASDWHLLQALLSAMERSMRLSGDLAGWLLVLQRLRSQLQALSVWPHFDALHTQAIQDDAGLDGLAIVLNNVDLNGQQAARWALRWWPAAGGGQIEWRLGAEGCSQPPLLCWPLAQDGTPASSHRMRVDDQGSAQERVQPWTGMPPEDLVVWRAALWVVQLAVTQALDTGVATAPQRPAWQKAVLALGRRVDSYRRPPLWRRLRAALRGRHTAF